MHTLAPAIFILYSGTMSVTVIAVVTSTTLLGLLILVRVTDDELFVPAKLILV